MSDDFFAGAPVKPREPDWIDLPTRAPVSSRKRRPIGPITFAALCLAVFVVPLPFMAVAFGFLGLVLSAPFVEPTDGFLTGGEAVAASIGCLIGVGLTGCFSVWIVLQFFRLKGYPATGRLRSSGAS